MDLVTEVREGLRQRMEEVDWLDSDTRKLAMEKVYKREEERERKRF